MLDTTKNYCTLYLLRHGETEWNVSHIVQGHKDSPLTANGLEQAAKTARELKDIKFDAIFSSDLLRAQRTAEIIKLERDLAIQTSHLLRERSFGHYEGMDKDNYHAATQAFFEKLQSLTEAENWQYKFGSDVESDEELVNRFMVKLREIAVAYPGKTIMVVTHGGCLRTFLMKMGHVKYGTLPAGAFQNAGYMKVRSDGLEFIIEEVKGLKTI